MSIINPFVTRPHRWGRLLDHYTETLQVVLLFVDKDTKKAELYRKGLNIQLQNHLIQNLSLLYNDLASTVVDQESTMKACEVVEEKKRKRTMSGHTRGSSSSAPLKYCMVYMPSARQSNQPPYF
jgi:hypothetical protein